MYTFYKKNIFFKQYETANGFLPASRSRNSKNDCHDNSTAKPLTTIDKIGRVSKEGVCTVIAGDNDIYTLHIFADAQLLAVV